LFKNWFFRFQFEELRPLKNLDLWGLREEMGSVEFIGPLVLGVGGKSPGFLRIGLDANPEKTVPRPRAECQCLKDPLVFEHPRTDTHKIVREAIRPMRPASPQSTDNNMAYFENGVDYK
jgi:hypothetical protein